MNIKQFSELTQVSAHTLRYYEKIGLLKQVNRTANGHRSFTAKDIDWVGFIKRLKEMGMELKKIQQYADLREQGDSTSEQRKQLLEEHVVVVENRIEVEARNLDKIKQKIQYYNKIIKN
ncbi:MAG: MerR family transcriptional regulator [Oleispira sp.]|nr:MerR family transcriptional regulator [Oleispira sp.]MBL4881146.1 MerR family transcriptional regulator [Oleispira sp.]